MKRNTVSGIVLMLLCTGLSALTLSIQTVGAVDYTDVTVTEAKSMIDSNPLLMLLDVRTQGEYDSGHIRNAKLIPVTELPGRLGELNQSDEILVYCGSGGRSRTASQLLVDNGFLYVYNMLGGTTSWISEGYPVYIQYSSIQEAIDNAVGGDTIFVSSGTYSENVVVNKTVSLVGENSQNTIVDGGNITSTITVTVDGVLVTGFKVTNGSSEYPNSGVFLDNAEDSIITGNDVSGNNGHGVFAMWGSNNSILHNFVTHNGEPGIRIDGTEAHATVANNTIEHNEHGVFLYSALDVLIENNTITDNARSGITPQGGSNNTVIQHNSISENVWHGIYVAVSRNSSINENTIASNEELGVYLRNSNNTTMCGNTLTNDSLYVRDSFGNTVQDNTVNGKPLVYLEGLSNQSVDTAGQVILVGCSNMQVNNVELSGGDIGLELWLTENSTVTENNMTTNLYGILLANSSNNRFYHNNLLNNERIHVYMPSYAPASINTWEGGYPSGGNYWDDYSDVDLYYGPNQDGPSSDGIWDHPYVLDENNEDNYPLAKPYIPDNLSVSIYTDKDTYQAGETMHLGLDITNPDSVKYQCFALVLEFPDSTLYPVMHQHSVVLPIGLEYSSLSFKIFNLPNIPSGTYTWHLALLERATHEILVHDTVEWVFS